MPYKSKADRLAAGRRSYAKHRKARIAAVGAHKKAKRNAITLAEVMGQKRFKESLRAFITRKAA